MAVHENAVHYLEIVTPDVEAASKLYGSAHGWTFQERPELGNAFVAEIPGGGLCGIRAPMHEQEAPIVRPYVRVLDLEAAVKEVAGSGAEILLESMQIPGHGTIAIYAHGGIQQGLWQVA